jgi:hypothetical protein
MENGSRTSLTYKLNSIYNFVKTKKRATISNQEIVTLFYKVVTSLRNQHSYRIFYVSFEC